MNVNIEGLSLCAVVAALYNNARPQGLGGLHYDPKPMTPEEAAMHGLSLRQAGASRIDYLKGRVMNFELVNPVAEFDPRLYDRDNGEGAAQRVVDELRASGTAAV